MNIVHRLQNFFLGTRLYPIKIEYSKNGSTIWSTRVRFKRVLAIKNNIDRDAICIEDVYGIYVIGKPATVVYTIDSKSPQTKKLYWIPENKQ